MTTVPVNGRAFVRDALISALCQRVPQVQDRVFPGRTWATPVEGFPAILVYANRESAQLLSTAGGAPIFRVSAGFDVICRLEAQDVQDPEDPFTRLEPALEEIEVAVKQALLCSADFFAQAGVEFCTAMETQLEVSNAADRSVGDARITFTLQWQETWPPDLQYRLATVQALKAQTNGEPQIGFTITLPIS